MEKMKTVIIGDGFFKMIMIMVDISKTLPASNTTRKHWQRHNGLRN